MRQPVLSAALLICTATGLMAQNQQQPNYAQVRVGLITTLTGGGKGLGIDIRDGFELALALTPEARIELQVEDDARDPAQARALAEGMIEDDMDVVTGLVWSNLALELVPLITESGRIYISPNAGPSQLAGEDCHKYYFNVSWQNDNIHEAMGYFMYLEEYPSPFILAPDYPAGKDALSGFKRYYLDPIAGEVYTELGATEYGDVIEQIKASGAETVYFFLPGGMGVNFFKQFRASGAEQDLLGPAFSFDQTILDVIGDDALGILNASQWVKEIDYPANKLFVEAFFETYDRYPSLYATQGYDAANLIIEASKVIEDASDPDALREALRTVELSSPRGPFRLDSNQHPIQDFVIRRVAEDENGLTNVFVAEALADRSSAYVDACPLGKE